MQTTRFPQVIKSPLVIVVNIDYSHCILYCLCVFVTVLPILTNAACGLIVSLSCIFSIIYSNKVEKLKLKSFNTHPCPV